MQEFEKNFDEWNEVKKSLDERDYVPPFFKEREVWWCSFGINIGSEVCGKNDYFRRPVLIVRKLSQNSFIGLPMSTKHKEGTWYVSVTHSGGILNTINLTQIRYFDYRRLDKKVGMVDTIDFVKIKNQLGLLLGV